MIPGTLRRPPGVKTAEFRIMSAVASILPPRARRPLLIAAAVVAGGAATLLYLELSGQTTVRTAAAESFYDLAADDLHGTPVAFSHYAGQVLLVVNVASECGLAFQYPGLEALHRQYRHQGFSVLAFPSHDFWQEPGGAAEIARTCALHGVTFPVFAKVGVRPGAGQSPVYAHLTGTGRAPIWNFAKYLVGRDGRVRAFFGSLVTPGAPELHRAIRDALAAPGPAAPGRATTAR
jgi:glutathione peroxidase